MHLSVVVPTYNRSGQLVKLLESFCEPMKALIDQVEIVICDDCSTDDTEAVLAGLPEQLQFFRYVLYDENIGLEQNLIHCVNHAKGDYVWIFGDDDFLEIPDYLAKILEYIKSDAYGMLVVNRTRRSAALDKLITPDWMGINGEENKEYDNISVFFKEWGLISVVGFITANIMKRELFLSSVDEHYYGTMYPQLGTLADAFSDQKVLLITDSVICHRTQTAEEKAESFKNKDKEKAFMSDIRLRNASYFGGPFIRMINILVEKGALSWSDINEINENTVINGRVADFLVQNIVDAVNLGLDVSTQDQAYISNFVNNIELSEDQVFQLSRYNFIVGAKFDLKRAPDANNLSISVITPSFNQVDFFHECLDSVYNQSYQPIEHIVLDPGSNDGSLNVARYYKGVQLINEPDEGQGDAVGKGIELAKGDIIAWVNSDDSYYDNEVFTRVAGEFSGGDEIIYGDGDFLAGDGQFLRDVYVNKDPSSLEWRFQQEDGIFQPALFFRKSIVDKIGLPSKYLEYCMDYEYWIRAMKQGVSFRYVNQKLAKAYFHIDNKTYGQRGNSYEQVCGMLFEQFGYVNHIWLKRYAEYLACGFDGVIASAANTGEIDQGAIDEEYISLMKRFNTSFDTVALLSSKDSVKGYGDTLRELKALSLLPEHCRLVEQDDVPLAVEVDYMMGGRKWRYEREWKNKQLEKSHAFFNRVLKERKSDTCVIVCNGPSLKNQDPAIFENFDVIASNNIFLSPEISKHVDYYTCVNYLVAEQSAPHINAVDCFKVLPWWLAYCVNEGDNTFFVEALGKPAFSTDIFENMSWRHTVTFFNMHLAYGLGYKKVCLVGCDHSYTQPKGVEEGKTIQSDVDDENHFDPRYFKSKKWQAADVNQMESMYVLAKEAFEADGRELINCTEGGKLELFRRSSLAKEVSPGKKISHIISSVNIGPYTRDDKVHFDETELIADYLGSTSDGLMIDVGTHHGYAAAPFLSKGWSVVGFEPDPSNRKILKDRMGDNPMLTIYENAVSDESGNIVSFYASEESTGISGMSKFRDSHKKVCEVETVTLSDVMERSDINAVDFLKIDTEGFDLMVLKGFPWSRVSPAIIECEFEDSKTIPLGYYFDDIAGYLVEKGYHVYVSEWHPVIRYGIQHQWKSLRHYPCRLSDSDAWGNLLAFKDKPDEQRLIKCLEKLALNKPRPDTQAESCGTQIESPTQVSSVQSDFVVNRRKFEAKLRRFPLIHKTFVFVWKGAKKFRNALR